MLENNNSHPFTVTNNNNLNGSEIIAGGSIIIPMDINVLETTISISKNGIYNKNPALNPLLSSLVIKAGITTVIGRS